MRRFALVCGLAVAVLFVLSVPQARADSSDNFTFTETTGGVTYVFSWTLPASPNTTGNFLTSFGFDVSAPTFAYADGVLVDPTPFVDTFVFYNKHSGMPDTFADALFGLSLARFGQLYTGQESDPTFRTGVYHGIDPNSQSRATLTIRAPEPSALVLLAAGLLAFLGAFVLMRLAA